jgi:hypothetical protein
VGNSMWHTRVTFWVMLILAACLLLEASYRRSKETDESITKREETLRQELERERADWEKELGELKGKLNGTQAEIARLNASDRAPQVCVDYSGAFNNLPGLQAVSPRAVQLSTPLTLKNTNKNGATAFNVKVSDISLYGYTAKFDTITVLEADSQLKKSPVMHTDGGPVSGPFAHAFGLPLVGYGIDGKQSREWLSTESSIIPVSVTYQDVRGRQFISRSELLCDHRNFSVRTKFLGIEEIQPIGPEKRSEAA